MPQNGCINVGKGKTFDSGGEAIKIKAGVGFAPEENLPKRRWLKLPPSLASKSGGFV